MRGWTINTENNDKIKIVSLDKDLFTIATSKRLIHFINLSIF
jgi:hypothetical protein